VEQNHAIVTELKQLSGAAFSQFKLSGANKLKFSQITKLRGAAIKGKIREHRFLNPVRLRLCSAEQLLNNHKL